MLLFTARWIQSLYKKPNLPGTPMYSRSLSFLLTSNFDRSLNTHSHLKVGRLGGSLHYQLQVYLFIKL